MGNIYAVADVYARAITGENGSRLIEVVIWLGGGAAGRSVFPVGRDSAREEAASINNELAKAVLGQDVFDIHAFRKGLKRHEKAGKRWQELVQAAARAGTAQRLSQQLLQQVNTSHIA